MTKLGSPVPDEIDDVRAALQQELLRYGFQFIDANSAVTGRDFLLKIWRMILSVPVGIGIICEGLPSPTVANVFYEIGLMQALGRETVVIKTPGTRVPSDFVRTEYIDFDDGFSSKIHKYLETVDEQADFYLTVASQTSKNPLLSLDYMKRSYLVSGNEETRKQACDLLNDKDVGQLIDDLNVGNLIDFSWCS